MNWSTQVTQMLGVKYPIIQAPMFGVTTPEMVAAATEAQALGSLALGDLSGAACRAAIQRTQKLVKGPFVVNIFVNSIPEVSDALRGQYAKAKSAVERLAHQHDIAVDLPEFEDIQLTDYREQVDAILENQCKIVSFTFGNLDPESISRLKAAGTILIGTCTCTEEALILEQSGIDIICVQGWEAGGHRGSFSALDIPQIGGLSLLAQVRDRVKLPLVYAGGIYNATTLLAAKQLGAEGFQIGSLLLRSTESALLDFEKQRLMQVKESDVVLTRSFSGRYARGIKNIFIETMDTSGCILPYPYQNKLTSLLRKAAKIDNNVDFVSIWTGQSIHSYRDCSTREIIQDLVEKVNILDNTYHKR